MGFKVKDHYYNKAKKENFLARSVYKLEEVDQRYSIISSGDKVLDLGYYPGSWMQYTSKKIGVKGRAVGIDIQEVNEKLSNLSNIRLIQDDIFEISSLNKIGETTPFDVVLSDMAPNTTGIRSVDQNRSLNLVEAVFELLPMFLKENGNFVIKVFESADAQVFFKEKRKLFKDFSFLRPKATRTVSKEYFAIGKGFQLR